ncbi:MAG: hypothetical protein AB1391_04685 [Candidatus Micrarchaeota archaeon]
MHEPYRLKKVKKFIPSKLNFDNALIFLKRVKSLGFRAEEIGIPLPEEKDYISEIPDKENFDEFLDADSDSFHQSLIFSNFPYTKKGAFAFAALSNEIAKNMPEIKKETKKEVKREIKENTEMDKARIFRFGKIRDADWRSRIENRSTSNIEMILDSLPNSMTLLDKTLKTQYAVYGDGNDVNCYAHVGKKWKRLFSIPFSENTWHVPGKHFIAAYSSDNGIYKDFHPSLGNVVFAATRFAEYGWICEEVNIKNLKDSAAPFAELYDEIYSLENYEQFLDLFVFFSLLKNAQFAEMGGKKIYAPEFFANIQYLFSKAEAEIARSSMKEALFFLRTILDLSLLALRVAPFGGKMLSVTKFFDENENLASRTFALSESIAEMLRNLRIDLEKSEKQVSKFSPKRGKDYAIKNGRIYANFGTLIALLNASDFFSTRMKKNEFWSSLRSDNAALFIASYENGEQFLSVLDEETIVARGSDLIKVELIMRKIIVKRAMILEYGKAKEIKSHLVKLIDVADKRSVDERNFLEETGNWGEAIYEFAGKENMVLINSKRFY